MYKKIITFLLPTIFLLGCTKEIAYEERSVYQIYSQAKQSLDERDYDKAAKQFEEVDRQHPYSQWAIKAQIMASYAYFIDKKYAESIGTLEAFMQLYPADKDIPYALYMISLSYFRMISPLQKDASNLIQSFCRFIDLQQRFPQTKYGQDALNKINILQDMLAGKEIQIARFYLRKRAYHSALVRVNVVIKKYAQTTYIQEALYRSVECYLALGLLQHAQKSAAVLGHNYPKSFWYKEAYNLIKVDHSK